MFQLPPINITVQQPEKAPAGRAEAFIRTAMLASALGHKYIESNGLDHHPRPVALRDACLHIRAERDAAQHFPRPATIALV